MKNGITFWIFSCAVGILISGSLRASDQQLVDRYYTMAYPGDTITLKANESAIIDGTVSFDGWPYMLFVYKYRTEPSVDLSLPTGLGLDPLALVGLSPDMPLRLPGPAIITLSTNPPEFGPLYSGAVGFRIVRNIHKIPAVAARLTPSEFVRYHTLTDAADKVTLRANQTAIIVGTTNICDDCSWISILYKRETNDFLNMFLPLGLTDGTIPLSGPGVVMLNTNDVNVGVLQLKIVQTKDQSVSGPNHSAVGHTKDQDLFRPYYTLAYPGDRLLLKANETAIIDSTVGFDWSYGGMNILYKRGTNDFTNMNLPLGVTGGTLPDTGPSLGFTMPLSGPGVVMLNTNDVSYGALYTGAVGFRVVRTIDRNESN